LTSNIPNVSSQENIYPTIVDTLVGFNNLIIDNLKYLIDFAHRIITNILRIFWLAYDIFFLWERIRNNFSSEIKKKDTD